MTKENFWKMIQNWVSFQPKAIQPTESSDSALVESYWGEHTVNSQPFETDTESLEYLGWRFDEYPLFRELMGLWGDHTNHVVLDYGCGPGNDVTGFLVHSNARKVIGMDISEKALALAQQRLSLHEIDPQRVELIKISDAEPGIPLEDKSVNYIYCEGVLHHTSYPEKILREFRRILKSDGIATIMVYNYDSIWLHLYTAYQKMIVENAFPRLTLRQAFARNTDGVECPISRCYKSEEFISMCAKAGFQTEYRGGYLSKFEMDLLNTLAPQALKDRRLSREHKKFLKSLVYDPNGYPLFQGKHAGIGGVYFLQ